jgi:ubiquinone/menaquinone biosynthesis C-methylase UbiE
MLELARKRFAGSAHVRVIAADMAHSLPDLGGRVDLVVSGFAIHHLEHDRKRELFAEILRVLTPGGLFVNLEVVASASPSRHKEFLQAIGRQVDDPEDRLAKVEDQCAWMREAGLVEVDCLWRWRGFALLLGNAPAAESG